MLSILNYGAYGSSLSVRLGAVRLGSAFSLFETEKSSLSKQQVRVGIAVSVMDQFTLGSSLTLRSFSRIAGTCSILDYTNFGSMVSARAFTRFGSGGSICGQIYGNCGVSILSMMQLGSCLSVRQRAILGD